MGKINKYSEEFKAKAVSMFEEIGPYRTAKELGVANQTLYRWRTQQKKKEQAASEEKEQFVNHPQSDTKETELPNEIAEIKEESTGVENTSYKPIQVTFLLAEVKRLKAENQKLQGTLNYLVQENKDLLEKRQRCLEALSLLIQ